MDLGTAVAILGYLAWPVLVLVVVTLLLVSLLLVIAQRIERRRVR